MNDATPTQVRRYAALPWNLNNLCRLDRCDAEWQPRLLMPACHVDTTHACHVDTTPACHVDATPACHVDRYESELGSFENAEHLGTDVFSQADTHSLACLLTYFHTYSLTC